MEKSRPFRILLLCNPRCRSTALMYSFAQRDDTFVVEEPLFAHFLRVTGLQRDHREEILRRRENDGGKVIEWMMRDDGFDKPIVVFKVMSNHIVGGLPLDFIQKMDRVIFVIRDVKDQLMSYYRLVDKPTIGAIGTKVSYNTYKLLEEQNIRPYVMDTDELVKNPEAMLQKLCQLLNIGFQTSMLKWKSGGREDDMLPGNKWYTNLHQSTGFTTKFEKWEGDLPDNLKGIYEEAKPCYDFLREKRIKIEE